MSYIIASDYLKQIQNSQFLQILQGDASVQPRAELAAIAEVTGYLVQKYDISREITETAEWSSAVAYKAGQRVYTTAATIDSLFYCSYPYDPFKLTAVYKKDDRVWYNDRTYKCKIATKGTSHEGQLQYGTIANIPAANVFPDNVDLGSQYWTDLGAYSVTAGTLTTDTTKWTAGDNRNQLLLMYTVDIVLFHLHCRIAPHNIPQLRQGRYDAAINWLHMAGRGDITADLPLIQPKQGQRMRYGSNVKTQTIY